MSRPVGPRSGGSSVRLPGGGLGTLMDTRKLGEQSVFSIFQLVWDPGTVLFYTTSSGL